jgi:hypothetical protein
MKMLICWLAGHDWIPWGPASYDDGTRRPTPFLVRRCERCARYEFRDNPAMAKNPRSRVTSNEVFRWTGQKPDAT